MKHVLKQGDVTYERESTSTSWKSKEIGCVREGDVRIIGGTLYYAGNIEDGLLIDNIYWYKVRNCHIPEDKEKP